ncbi:MAG TPA: hypothetical protein VE990_13865 [Acidimicrobiales bacterium]|nr:hypothetical protein [Acidimicrobiales bacterium]
MSVSYGVKNVGGGTQKLTSVVVSVTANSSGYVLDTASGNAAVTGCLASWFSVDNTGAPTAQEVTAGSVVTGTAAVTMTDVNASQDSCQGVSPQVTISVS